MNCDEIVKALAQNVEKGFTVEKVDKGCIISTPYLDPDNDPISVFLEKRNDSYRLSDQTRTMEYLFLHGIDIREKSKQNWYLKTTLNRLDVLQNSKELYLEVTAEDMPNGVLRLIEAMRSAEHLIFTAKTRTQIDFKDDVAIWLEENNITFERRPQYIGTTGKPINVDFLIHRHENEIPTFLYALHAETKYFAKMTVNTTIVNYSELRDAAKFKYVRGCILDDDVEEDVWTDNYALLKKYTDIIGFWDERDDMLERII